MSYAVTHDCVIHTMVLPIISLRGLIMYSKPWFVIMHTRPHTVMNIYIIEDKKNTCYYKHVTRY